MDAGDVSAECVAVIRTSKFYADRPVAPPAQPAPAPAADGEGAASSIGPADTAAAATGEGAAADVESKAEGGGGGAEGEGAGAGGRGGDVYSLLRDLLKGYLCARMARVCLLHRFLLQNFAGPGDGDGDGDGGAEWRDGAEGLRGLIGRSFSGSDVVKRMPLSVYLQVTPRTPLHPADAPAACRRRFRAGGRADSLSRAASSLSEAAAGPPACRAASSPFEDRRSRPPHPKCARRATAEARPGCAPAQGLPASRPAARGPRPARRCTARRCPTGLRQRAAQEAARAVVPDAAVAAFLGTLPPLTLAHSRSRRQYPMPHAPYPIPRAPCPTRPRALP